MSLSNVLNLYSSNLLLPSGILVNKDGIPEEEENFDEAIKAVNTALVPTRVRKIIVSDHSFTLL